MSPATYDGVALTQLINRDPVASGTDTHYNDIWYLDNPATSTGLISANVSSRGNVTVFGLSGTAGGSGATVISASNQRTVDLTTTGDNSIVIVSWGIGGNGNTAGLSGVSANAPLTTAGWSSLADQDYEGNGPPNGSGNGWEEAGGSDAGTLAEAYLLGDSTIAATEVINMGSAYNTSVDAQDLTFRYLTESGKIYDGNVEYISDYDDWAGLYTGDLSNPSGDLVGDGISNTDERIWGLNPTNPYLVPLDSDGSFSYTRRDTSLSNLTYTVWTSPDLEPGSWVKDTGASQTPSVPDMKGVETVAVTLSATAVDGRLFVRIQADE